MVVAWAGGAEDRELVFNGDSDSAGEDEEVLEMMVVVVVVVAQQCEWCLMPLNYTYKND
jgi:hypothetical protein